MAQPREVAWLQQRAAEEMGATKAGVVRPAEQRHAQMEAGACNFTFQEMVWCGALHVSVGRRDERVRRDGRPPHHPTSLRPAAMSLVSVQNAFYQGAYRRCIAQATSQTSFADASEPGVLSLLLYAARAQIALGEPQAALELVPASAAQTPSEALAPAASAVRQLATYSLALDTADLGAADDALAALTELAADAEFAADTAELGVSSPAIVRLCTATAMVQDGDPLGALDVLSAGSVGEGGDLELVALRIHILLSINRTDLAQQLFTEARSWAEDSLLIQLVEAWIGLARGGRAAQQAYYVYDEMATAPTAATSEPSDQATVLAAKAASQMALSQWGEAEATLNQAKILDPSNANVLANVAILAPHLSRTEVGLQEAITYVPSFDIAAFACD